jgi:hypothetical protein
MLREYFVVGRYIAQIPKDKNITEFILNEVESELREISPNQLKGYLNGLFSVIEGEEIDIEDEEDE